MNQCAGLSDIYSYTLHLYSCFRYEGEKGLSLVQVFDLSVLDSMEEDL